MSDDDYLGDALAGKWVLGGGFRRKKRHHTSNDAPEKHDWDSIGKDKQQVLEALAAGYTNMFSVVSPKLCDDEDVILAAMKSRNYPDILDHAGPNVRLKKSVVMEAMNYMCEGAYKNARAYIEHEKGISINGPLNKENCAPYSAIDHHTRLVFSDDYSFSKRLKECDNTIYFPFENLHSLLLEDRDFILQYATLPYSFVLDSVEWARDDEEIVLIELGKGQKGAFKQVSERLQDKSEVALTAIRSGATDVLPHIGPTVKADKEFFKKAAELGCKDALKYANKKLKDDENFVREMISILPESYLYASDRLKENKSLKELADRPRAVVDDDRKLSRLSGHESSLDQGASPD